MSDVLVEKQVQPTAASDEFLGALRGIGIYGAAILVALAITSIFIAVAGGNILDAYTTIIEVSLGNTVGFAQTLNKWTPLLLGSLAVSLGNRAGVFNIGVNGQIYMGAIWATGVGLFLEPLGLSPFLALPLVLIAGMAGGGVLSGLAGALKARYGVNEIFVTVMLNFVALYLTEYLASGPWGDPMAGEAITRPIAETAELPMIISRGGGHIGILLGFLLTFGIYFLLEKSMLGYNFRAVGDNKDAAIIGGINYKLMVFLGLLLSGVLSGLAGAIEVAGVHRRLVYGLSPNYGPMAILIAAVGRNNPFGVLVASFFFAVLLIGSDSLQRSVGLPASAVVVFQAVMFLALLVAQFFSTDPSRRSTRPFSRLFKRWQ